jgi:spermidine/putrescine-binding protein
VWAAPYRWGCTLLLYRVDAARRAGGPLRDWDDLLRPALRGRLAFVDSPRELVAVALRTLGLPPGAGARQLAACGVGEAALAARVAALAAQVRVFSSVDHVRALGAGEVDVVVGWSDDLVPLAARQGGLALAAPLSGTALYADAWCVPAGAAGG